MLVKLNHSVNHAFFLKISAFEIKLYRHLLFKDKHINNKILNLNCLSKIIWLINSIIYHLILTFTLTHIIMISANGLLEIYESLHQLSLSIITIISLDLIFTIYMFKDTFYPCIQRLNNINIESVLQYVESPKLLFSRALTSGLMMINIVIYTLLLFKQNCHSLTMLKKYISVVLINITKKQQNISEYNCLYKLDLWTDNIAHASLTELIILEEYYLEKDNVRVKHASTVYEDDYANRPWFTYSSINPKIQYLDEAHLKLYKQSKHFFTRLVMYDLGYGYIPDNEIMNNLIGVNYSKLMPALTFFAKTDVLRNKLKCLPKFTATHQELIKVLAKTNNDPCIANLILQYHTISIKNKSFSLKSNEIRSIFGFQSKAQ